jgi:glyoxylase-like metal-dependent hydrolase (beta-lactamase superfamily II)
VSTAAVTPWEVVAVRYGTLRTNKSDLYHRYHSYGEVDAPQVMDFYFYVLRRGGELVVVDTGFSPAAAVPRGRECLTEPAQALARLGVEAAAVPTLVITHLHWDHIGNVELFSGARILVPQRERAFWSSSLARNPQFWAHTDADGLRQVEEAAAAGRVVETGAAAEIAPGVRAITVGGHSPGQQILVVATRGGEVVLASDAVHLHEELELERPFGVISNLGEMLEAYALVKGMRAAGATVVPGHDPLVIESFPPLEDGLDGFAHRIA